MSEAEISEHCPACGHRLIEAETMRAEIARLMAAIRGMMGHPEVTSPVYDIGRRALVKDATAQDMRRYIVKLEAEIERLHDGAHSCAATIGGLEAEIARLRQLAADLMDLVNAMPIKHPQQATRRKILSAQCQSFGVK